MFERGSPPRGVYLVESGQVRLLVELSRGSPKLLEIAGPGCVLGLSETMSGENHKLTAEAADRTQAAFIPRQDLLHFLRDHHEYCLDVVRILSEDLHVLYNKFRATDPATPRRRTGRNSRTA